MKIKLKTRYAGTIGNYNPGSIIDVPSKEAAQLIAGNYAESIEEKKIQPVAEIETQVIAPVETADVKIKNKQKSPFRSGSGK